MKRDRAFDTVIKANKEYVEAVHSGASAKEQNNLLRRCQELMFTMILDIDRATEYGDYCKELRANGLW